MYVLKVCIIWSSFKDEDFGVDILSEASRNYTT